MKEDCSGKEVEEDDSERENDEIQRE